MLSDKFKIEKEQNLQLRNQITQFLQAEQEQKLQIEEKNSAIQMLQVGSEFCLKLTPILENKPYLYALPLYWVISCF